MIPAPRRAGRRRLPQSCCRCALFRHGGGADHGGMPEPVQVWVRKPNPNRTGSRDLADAGRSRDARSVAGGRRQPLSDRSRCAVGKLHRVYPGVYAAVAPELLTEEGQLLAALLGAGEGALLSHATAAWRWRIIPAPPSVMQLALPRDHAQMEGVTLFVSREPARRRRHPQRPLPQHHRGPHPAGPRDPLHPPRAPARPRRSRVPARPAPAGHPAHAAPRAPRQREPAGGAEAARARPRRDEEPAGAALPPAAHPPAGSSCRCATSPSARGPSTACGRERRVAVELDGRQHQRPHQADSDDDRDLWLRRHGYVTRRYGKRQIDQHPDDVIADLLAALA